MKNILKNFVVIIGVLFPFGVFAQSTLWTVTGVLGNVIWSLGWILPILAFVVFFYGLAKFILASGDLKKLEEGKGIMIWGLVAIFVLMSIVGIIGLIDRSLGTDQGPGNVDFTMPILPG
jgi:hypothetical protein